LFVKHFTTATADQSAVQSVAKNKQHIITAYNLKYIPTLAQPVKG